MDDPTMALRSLLHGHSSQMHNAAEAARIRNDTADFDAVAAAATLVQVPSSMMVISSSDSDIVDVGGLGVVGLAGTSIEEEDGEDDVADIASAAEAASQALEANDAAVSQQQELEAAGFCDPTVVIPNHVIPITSDHTNMSSMVSRDVPQPALPLRCRICQQGEYEGRPIIRFLASNHNDHRLTASAPGGGTLHLPPPPPPPGVSSFTEEIQLHVFCGKTASILPNVNQPDLEILTKAGLKNKHGIGPEVNAALARTRCAVIPNSTGSNDTSSSSAKEKQYYLVREFEAHLASIRNAHINFMGSNEGGSSTGGVHLSLEQQALTQDPYNNYQQPQQDQLQSQHLQAQHQYLNRPGGPPPQPTNFYYPYSDSALDSTLQLQLPPPPELQQQQAPSHYSSNSYDPYSVNNNHGSHNRNSSTANGSIAQTNNNNTNQKPRRANKAAAGQIAKPKGGRRRRQQEVAPMPFPPLQDNGHNTMMAMDTSSTWSYQDTCSTTPGGEILTPEGKVKCGCGGTHWPSGTSKGSSSWRSHVMTKKHQKWMEDNGMLGAV